MDFIDHIENTLISRSIILYPEEDERTTSKIKSKLKDLERYNNILSKDIDELINHFTEDEYLFVTMVSPMMFHNLNSDSDFVKWVSKISAHKYNYDYSSTKSMFSQYLNDIASFYERDVAEIKEAYGLYHTNPLEFKMKYGFYFE